MPGNCLWTNNKTDKIHIPFVLKFELKVEQDIASERVRRFLNGC
jgi:hypothetical protein